MYAVMNKNIPLDLYSITIEEKERKKEKVFLKININKSSILLPPFFPLYP
jgi:hypothetical protein